MLVCTCTSTRMIPSVATWISGQLGIYQTHASCDIVAACAGMPYGLADATRHPAGGAAAGPRRLRREVLRQDRQRSSVPHDLRRWRRRYGRSALPRPGEPPDIEYLQTYASGPASQVNSIIWPNPAFDNNITVYGPEVKALAGRYLVQMIDELKVLPDPDGAAGVAAGEHRPDRSSPGQQDHGHPARAGGRACLPTVSTSTSNRSATRPRRASPWPSTTRCATESSTEPMRIFAPGFGAGAVAGYCVMRIDPAMVALDPDLSARPIDGEPAIAARAVFRRREAGVRLAPAALRKHPTTPRR